MAEFAAGGDGAAAAGGRGAKKAKLNQAEPEVPDFGAESDGEEEDVSKGPSMIVQFTSMEGEGKGPQIDIPLGSTVEQMEQVVNKLLGNTEDMPYCFYIGDTEVTDSLGGTVQELGTSTENVLTVLYQPLAIFRVRPVTRCTDTMPGHTEAVLHVSYSPDGSQLASGGGDMTVRFWDVNTCTPRFTCRGHRHHVLCTAWSPDGKRFASADRKGEIRLWDPATGQPIGSPLVSHKQWVTSLSWEPMHKNAACERLASSSKDGLVKVWNVRTGRCLVTLSGHADSVECVKWGGEGLLYSASRDRNIMVWSMDGEGRKFGILVRTLAGHGHRVNTLALSCEYVLRTGPFGHKPVTFATPEEAQAAALARYQEAKGTDPERLVSGSDDFTLFLWNPVEDKKPLARLTGHQQAVNHIAFSPDGRRFASASFDKKVKVWDGRTGKFLATLTGHVGAVYQVAWSADSRLLVSASKDSTVKLWEMASLKRAKATLPGHADEVYTLDWSPNGQQLASGSKDRTIKIWKN
eukprot:TRINITY_DN152_c0_g1_i1.p1 TRINITY_DN152_c0_g1~~TRINITY_DN152_c0_g1_i1.p1  ORF type:complete len:520 (-),score=86.80 TRINITY_DN152_c0_g1_i1:136-1695(-)